MKHCNTKRQILSEIARLYDPLGLVSPTTLVAKLLYRDICDAKITWDGQLPESLLKRWKDWRLANKGVTVPRPLTPYHIAVAEKELHSFGDASSQGVCAAVFAAIRHGDEVTQGLVCAKSRIAKRNLTIPRLELVAGHMTVNLASNVEAALSMNYEVGTHCWLDSTVALYWIKGRGDCRQFVANRVQKIKQHEHVTWHHVPTAQNSADLGSRCGSVENHQL